MKRLNVLFAIGLVIAGCKQNPFPTDGRLVQGELPKLAPALPPLILEFPEQESLYVHEGQKLEFTLGATVPAPGLPIVEIQGMPPGATYDDATRLFRWIPGFNAANDPRDTTMIVRPYTIRFSLSSSENRTTVTSRSMMIVVRDVPQNVSMPLPPAPVILYEGKVHEQQVTVFSSDYPQGPFDLQIENMPVGVEIHRDLTNLAKFKIRYTPSFREVNVLTNTSYSIPPSVEKAITLTAFGPRGINVSGKMTWKILDERQFPTTLLPTKVTQGTSAGFVISAEDVNGEVPPTIIMSPKPTFGIAELKEETRGVGNAVKGINPSVVYSFRWTQIPPDKIGTTQKVRFATCVQQSRNSKSFCKTNEVAISFENETHEPPIIDRTLFPLGTVRYVREQEKITIPVRVRDGEFSTTPPIVKVLPSTLANEVKWANGQLEITGRKAGLKQITLEATSVFSVVKSETFLVEVLPWSWSSVLLFGEGPTDPEVRASSALFESAQVANPVLQLSDPRLTVLRKTVFMGTTALAEPSAIGPMEKLAADITDVVISTPLAGKLEGALGDEMDAIGVRVGNRLADITGYTLEVAPASGLTLPSSPIKLNAGLTGESERPAPVDYNGGLFGTACRSLLFLTKAGETPIPVVQSCKRTAGGRLIVAGIEFGDIVTSPADSRLVKTWLKGLVNQ